MKTRQLIFSATLFAVGCTTAEVTAAPSADPKIGRPDGGTEFEKASRETNYGWGDSAQLLRSLNAAVRTGSASEKARALREFENPYFKRSEVIEILSGLLSSPDWEIRTKAAATLLKLGSNAGVGVLNTSLREAMSDGGVSAELANVAVTALAQARIPIDAPTLHAVYRRTQVTSFLEIAAYRGHDWVVEEIREFRKKSGFSVTVEIAAAVAARQDDASIAYFRKLAKSNDPDASAIGRWALFRALGDCDAFRSLLDDGRKILAPASRSRGIDSNYRTLIGLLSATKNDEVDQLMREVVERGVTGSFSTENALWSLYFVQRDYEYLDTLTIRMLSPPTDPPSQPVGGELLWRIAVVRGTPEIERLAFAKNSTAYEHYFVRLRGRPLTTLNISN